MTSPAERRAKSVTRYQSLVDWQTGARPAVGVPTEFSSARFGDGLCGWFVTTIRASLLRYRDAIGLGKTKRRPHAASKQAGSALCAMRSPLASALATRREDDVWTASGTIKDSIRHLSGSSRPSIQQFGTFVKQWTTTSGLLPRQLSEGVAWDRTPSIRAAARYVLQLPWPRCRPGLLRGKSIPGLRELGRDPRQQCQQSPRQFGSDRVQHLGVCVGPHVDCHRQIRLVRARQKLAQASSEGTKGSL